MFLADRQPELFACRFSDPGLIPTQPLSSSSRGFSAFSPGPAFLGGPSAPLCHSSPLRGFAFSDLSGGFAFSVGALAARHNPKHRNWSTNDGSGGEQPREELVLLPVFCFFLLLCFSSLYKDGDPSVQKTCPSVFSDLFLAQHFASFATEVLLTI